LQKAFAEDLNAKISTKLSGEHLNTSKTRTYEISNGYRLCKPEQLACPGQGSCDWNNAVRRSPTGVFENIDDPFRLLELLHIY
jgi:hypothetical protein